MIVVATICGAFLAFISGVQGGVAQPADGSSTGLSQLFLLSSSLLLAYSHLDHLSRVCFDQRSIGIRQPYPSAKSQKKYYTQTEGGREPLQNPKHLVFHINVRPQCVLHIVGHLDKLAEAHPSTHPSHQVFQ